MMRRAQRSNVNGTLSGGGLTSATTTIAITATRTQTATATATPKQVSIRKLQMVAGRRLFSAGVPPKLSRVGPTSREEEEEDRWLAYIHALQSRWVKLEQYDLLIPGPLSLLTEGETFPWAFLRGGGGFLLAPRPAQPHTLVQPLNSNVSEKNRKRAGGPSS